MGRYRVLVAKVEVREYGVLQTRYFDEITTLDESAARPLVEAGAITPADK